MRFRFAMGVVGIVLAAILGVASPAMAKGGGGGGGGGGGSCATITSWTPDVQNINGQPWVVLDVGVFNGCVDAGTLPDKMPVVGLTTSDTATGAFISRSAIMASYGQQTYRFYIGAPTATPPARTITVDVIKPNGSVQDVRSATLAQIMQSVTVAA